MFDSNQSREQAKINGSKGGKASVKAKKEKAELKKLFIQYANMKPIKKEADQLIAMGFDDKELTNMTSFVVGMFKKGANGNSKAMELSVELMMDNDRKELENQKLREEIQRLKLEQEKIKRELNMSNDSFEDLTPLAELLSKKDK